MALPACFRATSLAPIVAALAALTASCSTAHVPPSFAPAGRLADVEVFDRTTGETLPVYHYRGERWIAGTPGHRYAIVLRNRSPGRVLTVLAVDGVNAVSGETAAWGQTGYVLDPGRSFDIRGWRKSQERVAAFEFTPLGNSYAARTGRPENVGVIGVAVFREAPRADALPLSKPAPPITQPPTPAPLSRSEAPASAADSASSGNASRADKAVGATENEPASPGARARAESRIGTGHGRSESSWVSYTEFERARPAPDEVITIRYDSRENLVAMGVLPANLPRPPATPRPFPGSELGFVPDPN